MSFFLAKHCSMTCESCLAARGKSHGQSGLMGFETGKRALVFLVEHSGTRHNLEVDFFGGEPLMNFEVCKQLVAYARSIEKEKGKNFRFTLGAWPAGSRALSSTASSAVWARCWALCLRCLYCS